MSRETVWNVVLHRTGEADNNPTNSICLNISNISRNIQIFFVFLNFPKIQMKKMERTILILVKYLPLFPAMMEITYWSKMVLIKESENGQYSK